MRRTRCPALRRITLSRDCDDPSVVSKTYPLIIKDRSSPPPSVPFFERPTSKAVQPRRAGIPYWQGIVPTADKAVITGSLA